MVGSCGGFSLFERRDVPIRPEGSNGTSPLQEVITGPFPVRQLLASFQSSLLEEGCRKAGQMTVTKVLGGNRLSGPFQSDFRSGSSTETALFTLVDDFWQNSMRIVH